jgi:hypothetical protein
MSPGVGKAALFWHYPPTVRPVGRVGQDDDGGRKRSQPFVHCADRDRENGPAGAPFGGGAARLPDALWALEMAEAPRAPVEPWRFETEELLARREGMLHLLQEALWSEAP